MPPDAVYQGPPAAPRRTARPPERELGGRRNNSRGSGVHPAMPPIMLSALQQALGDARLVGGDVEVARATADSRKVRPGDLFVAVPGRRTDGHDFAPQATASGAAAALVERELPIDIPQLVVPSAERAFGRAAAMLCGSPAEALRLVGITGTNGKTTISYMVEAMLRAAGREVGVMGTTGYRFADRSISAAYTTPTPDILQPTLAEMVEAGCGDAVLEVSSAALAMHRLEGAPVQVAAFSNLSRDHLDVHGSFEAYREAKARLFRDVLASGGAAVVFLDDPHADTMIAAADGRRLLRVSLEPDANAEIRAERVRADLGGVRVCLDTPRGAIEVASSVLFGAHNAANLAIAVGIGEALELSHAAMREGIAGMPGVPGRLERVANDRGLDLFVDYAHTPAALENVLAALRPLTSRRLLCVFGCGGDRDRDKRPEMGAAAEAGADLVFVTSDNPRSEDPEAIARDVLGGMRAPHAVELDRTVAIEMAVAEATPGDAVLIAGKGHETYQIVGDEILAFDDREEAAGAAAARPRIEAGRVADITGGALVAGDPAEVFSRVIIDGRRAAPGDLYVAIRGERFDGHAFCEQAIAAGASGALVECGRGEEITGEVCVVETDDPREGLGALARDHARRWRKDTGGKLVAITGSAGKTTTVSLVAAALGAAGRVHRSQGSLNNETGVPLTLFGLRRYHDFGVVEMGMRGLGQIAYLAGIAEPDVGVVVNAGTAHIGVVGSADAIAQGKGEIFGGLANEGAAVFPAFDARLATRAAAAPRRLGFGDRPGADVQLLRYEPVDGGSRIAVRGPDGADCDVHVPLYGRHNAENAVCALAAACALGIPLDVAASGIARAEPPSMRAEIAEVAGRRVFVDCYNANPASMEAALAAIAERRGENKAVAVLGDMLELGDEEEAAHRDAGRRAAELGFEVVALGDRAEILVDGATAAGGAAAVADGPDAAAREALARTGRGDWILLKASRGARLERVLEALRAV